MMDAPPPFPIDKIRKKFAEWWAEEQLQAEFLAEDAPPPKRPLPVLAPIVEIDSHRAVRALLTVEPLVGFKIPARIIQMGGYETFDGMVDHLVAELLKLAEKKIEKSHA